MAKKTNKSSLEEFQWPEFNNDRLRIKALSQRYAGKSITEAFELYSGKKISNVDEMVNYIPDEIRLGSIFKTRILSVDKTQVVFDNANYKANFQSSVNLYKYDFFKHYVPVDPVEVQVTRINKDKVTVDPIAPIMNGWLNPILKDNSIQKNIYEPKTIKVKILQLTRGGFIGKAIIPAVSEFVGENYLVDAFIPGSQIVLNITDNFEQFVGKTVEAFVVNYIPKPGSSDMSLVCSAKEFMKFKGELNIINMFKAWCEESEEWNSVAETSYKGKVTGVINTSKKCGVFVEIPELNITGMVKTKPEELVSYKPHDDVNVKISGFEEEMVYNSLVKQLQHDVPYVIEDDCLKRCNIKPVLQIV